MVNSNANANDGGLARAFAEVSAGMLRAAQGGSSPSQIAKVIEKFNKSFEDYGRDEPPSVPEGTPDAPPDRIRAATLMLRFAEDCQEARIHPSIIVDCLKRQVTTLESLMEGKSL